MVRLFSLVEKIKGPRSSFRKATLLQIKTNVPMIHMPGKHSFKTLSNIAILLDKTNCANDNAG